MKLQQLKETTQALFISEKGLLAMDESTGTCNKRFAKLGIPQTVEARRAYRELIVTTPGLGESIGGAILYDETIRQQTKDGAPFVKVLVDAGIIPGIKVDTGAKELAGHPGEKVTEGLDGLRDRLQEYLQMGARFAKWRAVIAIGRGIPSWGCIEANAHALARYAALCQEEGLVPVVEPEVVMDGEHTLEQCREITDEVLRAVFSELFAQRVVVEGMVLKPNMVLPGTACASQPTLDFGSACPLQSGCASRRIFPGDGDEMTGSKHNLEGNSGDRGEPDPGPYWRRMHRDWRFWVGAVLMAAALSVYVLSGDLAWVPNGHRQSAMPASAAN
jgi:fructose-bisphosphate aldolase class I